jgi:DNA topoisomerase II
VSHRIGVNCACLHLEPVFSFQFAFLLEFWPSLLDVPGFLQQFITPIVKATKGKKAHTFFTLPEYEIFKASTGNDAKGYTIKYYKGLGTSTASEAKEYFSNLGLHEVHFQPLSEDICIPDSIPSMYANDMDFDVDSPVPDKCASGSDLIDMVFAKARVEDRKSWLNNLEKDTFLNYAEAQEIGIKYSDFVNKEFILFSQADNARSIPHVVDGFKPSQRKILFACFKRKLKNEIKVAQLAGYVSEHSAYHHGEASLTGAIIGMAQNFCGSNNINLLTPSGQFGTRRMGGKDAASPRYVFTKLENVTRTIFHPDDDELLSYLHDDGLSIEPEFYVPVIPMVLVNGSDGIGTGWSSTVPTYNPRSIISNIRKLIMGEDQEKMHPFYYGYGGEIIPETGKRHGSYVVRGKVERINDTTLFISELPIKKWTQDYKQFLEEMLVGSEKKEEKKKAEKTDKSETDFEIKDFKENHTDATVAFTVTVASPEIIDLIVAKEKNGLIGKLKLSTSVATSNMHLFNEHGRIEKYESPEDIISSFFDLRLHYYDMRKALLLSKMRRDQMMLSNKARFVEEVCSGVLVVSNRKRADILATLQDRGFDLMEKAKDDTGHEEDEDDTKSDAELARGYEYLLGMKIWSLTYEKAEELRAQLAEKTKAVANLEATKPSKLWLDDLDSIEEALDERDAEMAAIAADEIKAQIKSKRAVQSKKKVAAKKTNAKDGWYSECDSGSDDDFKAATKIKEQGKSVTVNKSLVPAKMPLVQAKLVAVARQQPVIRQRQPAMKKAESMAKKNDDFISESSDDDEGLSDSLAERMKQKLMVSPPPKKSRPDASVSNGSRNEVDSDDELEMFDSEVFKPASVTPARTTVAATKKLAVKKPANIKPKAVVKTKPVAVKQPKPAAAPIVKKKINLDSDDDDFSDPVVAPRAQSGRARQTIRYDHSDDSESDFDEDSD